MKISEMTNEQAADALIQIAEPFGNICGDEEMLGLLEKMQNTQERPVIQTLADVLPKFVLYALKKHRGDLYAIIGALTMRPVAEVARMNFKSTVAVVRESYDDIIRDFFTSSVPVTMKSES